MNNLKALRRIKGITQAQLGEKIGLGQRDISNIELGNIHPTPKDIKKICKYFKATSKLVFPELINKGQKITKRDLKCEITHITHLDDDVNRVHWYIILKLENISHFLNLFEDFTNNSCINIFKIKINSIDLCKNPSEEYSYIDLDISTSFHRYKNIMNDFIKAKLTFRKTTEADEKFIDSLFDNLDLGGDEIGQ